MCAIVWKAKRPLKASSVFCTLTGSTLHLVAFNTLSYVRIHISIFIPISPPFQNVHCDVIFLSMEIRIHMYISKDYTEIAKTVYWFGTSITRLFSSTFRRWLRISCYKTKHNTLNANAVSIYLISHELHRSWDIETFISLSWGVDDMFKKISTKFTVRITALWDTVLEHGPKPL